MRIGLAVDLGSKGPIRPQIDRAVDLIKHAERHGFESVWVGESFHATPEPFHLPASLMVLSHLAGRTSLDLGTAVLLLRAYSPEKIAYEAALLDQLCDGKFTLGLGLGPPDVAQRTGNSRPARSAREIDSALKLLRVAWTTPHGPTEHPLAVPQPIRLGGPKVLVGGKSAASVRRADALADGFYGATNYADDLLMKQATAFWSLRAGRAGSVAGDVATTRLCLVHEDADTARALAERYFRPVLDYYIARNSWVGTNGPTDVELPLVGSPTQVRKVVSKYVEVGVTLLQLRIAPVNIPPEVVRHTIELVGNEVLPAGEIKEVRL